RCVIKPARTRWLRWKVSEDGRTPRRSAMTPADSPSGPTVTRSRNRSSRVSWLSAERASSAAFFSTVVPTNYFDDHQNRETSRRSQRYFEEYRIECCAWVSHSTAAD